MISEKGADRETASKICKNHDRASGTCSRSGHIPGIYMEIYCLGESGKCPVFLKGGELPDTR